MPRAAMIYSDDLLSYEFGPCHPLRSIRLKMACDLMRAYGLLDNRESILIEPRPATDEELLAAHDAEYVEAVRRLSEDPGTPVDPQFGFHLSDNPPFAGMYEASSLYTGASAQAARMIMEREFAAVFSISGGLHHAQRARASGFCVFNDAVVAIHLLLEKFRRVAYVDIDAHHGDGVQEAFYDTDEVLTVSIHESGRWLFPGSGSLQEIGEGSGKGYSVNAPLEPGAGDADAVRVFDSAIVPIIRAFAPQVLVAQLGADGHFSDPLTHLAYTSQGWLAMVQKILSFGVPTVALGGGGYDVRAVCRLWTLAYAEMLGEVLADAIPSSFSDEFGITRLRDDVQPQVPVSKARAASRHANEVIDRLRGRFPSAVR